MYSSTPVRVTRTNKIFTWKKCKAWIGKVCLSVYSLLTLYPLYWLFISAFKSNQEFFGRPFDLPISWNFDNFARAWKVSGMGIAMINSVIVTFAALFLMLISGTIAAYILSKFEFRLKAPIMGLFLLGMLIPIHSTLVPLFIMMKKFHLLDTYLALILPYTSFQLPICIFVIAAFLTMVPKEVEEAALIDGSGYWGIFIRIIMPLSIPAMATVGILGFLQFWNDFAFPLVFINNQAMKTLPLSLSVFATGYGTDYSLTTAAMAIAVIPTIVIYLIFQEKIMNGMVAGAVKG
jgi:raffinose/stachyose/melibiose transport system permease protein